MANTRSAKKRIRQTERRRLRNRAFLTRARTYVRRARIAVEEADPAAVEAVRQAISELDHAAFKGVLHRNNSARRKSRLMKQLAAAQKKP